MCKARQARHTCSTPPNMGYDHPTLTLLCPDTRAPRRQAFFADIYAEAQKAAPGRGHEALAAVAALGRLRRHYTLNIDGLAEAVGLATWHPTDNPAGAPRGAARAPAMGAAVALDPSGGIGLCIIIRAEKHSSQLLVMRRSQSARGRLSSTLFSPCPGRRAPEHLST